jgi:uncharacterized protein (TIGR02145 family)
VERVDDWIPNQVGNDRVRINQRKSALYIMIKTKRKRILLELSLLSVSIFVLSVVFADYQQQTYADDPITKICHSNNESNCDTYGALYTWSMAMDLDSSCDTTDCSAQIETPHQGICPEGWHLPTDAELKELEMELGMSEAEANSTGWRGSPVGSKLAGNETLWGETRTIVTTPGFNDSGFMGLPAGRRSTDGSSFANLGVATSWWSSSQSSATSSWRRHLNRDYSDVYRHTYNKLYGFSVRCLRD